jgi:Domain of unknown function (DUF305)
MSGTLTVAPTRPSRFLIAASLLLLTGFIAAGGFADTALEPERAFLRETQAAMDEMMGAMDVKLCGDVDADFAAAMIPHHQGAIEMAQAELRHGRSERLRRIAQEIIVDQQQEIVAMRLALGQPSPAAPVDDPPSSTDAASLPNALVYKICTGSPR